MTLGELVCDLPRAPGVYVFHGDGKLPLYIGKSVDIRSRVQSHLRNPDEARMMAQTRRIEAIETAGEIGALLLESHLIKTQSPLFNQRLRRIKKLCRCAYLIVAKVVQISLLCDRRWIICSC